MSLFIVFSSILEVPWGLIFHTFLKLSLNIFLDPSQNHLISTLGRFGVHLASILGAVLATFWGTGPKVKIELSSRRELNSGGPGISKIITFSGPFLRGAPRAHRIYLFMDFLDFGVILGPPWAPPERFVRTLFLGTFSKAVFSKK